MKTTIEIVNTLKKRLGVEEDYPIEEQEHEAIKEAQKEKLRQKRAKPFVRRGFTYEAEGDVSKRFGPLIVQIMFENDEFLSSHFANVWIMPDQGDGFGKCVANAAEVWDAIRQIEAVTTRKARKRAA